MEYNKNDLETVKEYLKKGNECLKKVADIMGNNTDEYSDLERIRTKAEDVEKYIKETQDNIEKLEKQNNSIVEQLANAVSIPKIVDTSKKNNKKSNGTKDIKVSQLLDILRKTPKESLYNEISEFIKKQGINPDKITVEELMKMLISTRKSRLNRCRYRNCIKEL